ncbi:MAG: hypothetical protein JW384_03466 [Nitrosomonadaceae bacterium]|nr:hypothetical protein [Nitrosomonadaceae bacterium]
MGGCNERSERVASSLMMKPSPVRDAATHVNLRDLMIHWEVQRLAYYCDSGVSSRRTSPRISPPNRSDP